MFAAAPSAVTIAAQVKDACGDNPGTLCRTVFNVTHSSYLSGGAEVFLAKPFRIIVILLIALIIRGILRRLIDRTIMKAAEGDVGALLRRRQSTARIAGVVDGTLLSERRRQRTSTVGSLLKSITSLVVFGIAFVTILGELGINLAPIVASAGVVGVAVGFGAQNLVRDFLTGIFMLLEDQYGVGDVIDAGPAVGIVEAVGLRTTRLRDVDGTVWHIRNGEITRIGNKSQGWSRMVLDMPVAYDTDVDTARRLLKEAAVEVWQDDDFAGMVLEEPEVWGIEALTRENLVIRLVAKTAPSKSDDVAREVRRRIRDTFTAAGIDLAVRSESVTILEGDGDYAGYGDNASSEEEETRHGDNIPAPTPAGPTSGSAPLEGR